MPANFLLLPDKRDFSTDINGNVFEIPELLLYCALANNAHVYARAHQQLNKVVK